MKKIGFGFLNKVKSKKIAFLDRDGIINVDHGYVYKVEDFSFVEGFLTLYNKIIELGYIPVVITNQSGVARGYFTLKDVQNFHNYINSQLASEGFPHIYSFKICPHHPSGKVENYAKECLCRKPKTGLIEEFASEADFDINWDESIMIGDKKSDVDLGINMKIKTIQLNSGKYDLNENATYIVKNLSQAIESL